MKHFHFMFTQNYPLPIQIQQPGLGSLNPNEFRGSHFPAFVKVHGFHSINRNYSLFSLEK